MIEFPPHIDWLKNRFGEKLQEKLGANFKLEDILQDMIAADPTSGKKLVDWMVRGLIQDNPAFRWEDIGGGDASKVHTVLKAFIHLSHNLSAEEKNINNYSSLSEIWKTIKPFIQENPVVLESNRFIKRKEREEALEESRVIYRDENIIVAVPLTRKAAVWWGKGTQWCTAADKNNYFDHYNNNAPLIVMIFEGEKFQLHTHEGDLQWMDENDHPIDPLLVKKNWKVFEPIVKWLMRYDGQALNYFPWNLLNQEIYDQAVSFTPWALPLVPVENRTREVCTSALEQSDDILEYIPEEFITAEILDKIEDWNGFTIARIDSPLMRDEIYIKALLNNPELLRFLPSGRINKNLITACVMGAKDMHRDSFFRVSCDVIDIGLERNWLTSECLGIVLEKVNILPSSLDFNRLEEQELITPEVFEILCKNFPNTLSRYSSIINASEQRVNCYLTYAESGLDSIRKELRTRKAYEAAVGLDAMVLSSVPKIWKDYDMYLLAAQAKMHNYEILDQVPEPYRTKDFYRALVSSEELNLRLVPKEMWDKQMIVGAVESNGYTLNYLDDDFVQNHLKRIEQEEGPLNWESLYLSASKTSANILKIIPRDKLTREICLNICAICFNEILIVPEEVVDDSFILELLDYPNRSIGYIPNKYFSEVVKDRVAGIMIEHEYKDDFFKDELSVDTHADIVARVEKLRKSLIKWDHTQLDQLHQAFETWNLQQNEISTVKEYGLG